MERTVDDGDDEGRGCYMTGGYTCIVIRDTGYSDNNTYN